MSKGKCMLIFSGFNERAVISFIRTLHANHIDYAIIAKSDDDPIFLTAYSGNVLAVRNSKTLLLEDLLLSIQTVKSKKIADEYIIAPTTEALNRFLLENRAIFESHDCKIPLVHKDLYELISNKYSFASLCSNYEISIPEEVDIQHQVSFPIVAKPKEYYSAYNREILSPIIIRDSIELDRFMNDYHVEDFYYQEYVNGQCFYLLYYFHTNGQVYKFSQKNLVQQPRGKSMLLAVPSDIHHSQESEKYEKLFRDQNFFGLVMVEIKRYNNRHYMIEANPRFWGPSQLFVDAGANFFEVFLHDLGFLDTFHLPDEVNTDIKYCWLGGFMQYLESSSEEVVFYDYDLKSFYLDFWQLLRHDIYLREDSVKIFSQEVLQKEIVK